MRELPSGEDPRSDASPPERDAVDEVALDAEREIVLRNALSLRRFRRLEFLRWLYRSPDRGGL